MRSVAPPDERACDTQAVLATGQSHAHQIGVVTGAAALGLLDLNSALLGDRRRVDLVDLLLGVPLEHAEQRLNREQAGVAIRDPAQEFGLHAVKRGSGQHGDRDLPEAPAQRHERAEHLHVLGRNRRHIDRARDHAARKRGDHLLGRLISRPVSGLGRGGAQVRGDDHVRIAEQGVVGDRLLAEHVECGAADLARVEPRL